MNPTPQNINLNIRITGLEWLGPIVCGINQKLNKIMATQDEEAQALAAIKDKLNKAAAEIVAKIAELTEAVKNAGTTTPEVDAATKDLTDLAQALDDIVPDPVA